MQRAMMVRMGAVMPFIRFLESMGANTSQLLEQTKLAYFYDGNSETLVPAIAADQFLEQAARQYGMDDLAVSVALQTSLMDVGAFGRLIRSAANTSAALQTAVQWLPTFASISRLRLDRYGPHVRLSHEFLDDACFGTQARLFGLLWFTKIVQQAAGDDWWPAEIHLKGGPTVASSRVEELSQTRVVYGRPGGAIIFSEACLRLAYNGSPDSTKDEQHDQEALVQTAPPRDFLEAVKYVVAALLPGGNPRIDDVAAALGRSVRTMQRVLAAYGLSYSRLVEKVRFDLSRELLARPTASVTSVAFDLGYSDTANFTRAFRRWTGLPPQLYRRQHLGYEAASQRA